MLRFLWNYARVNGLRWTAHRLWQWGSEHLLRTWDRQYRRHCPTPEELEQMRQHPPNAGLMSILIPVYNTDPAMLKALLQSIADQVYPQWECILYNAGDRADTTDMLRQYADRDERFRVFQGENGGISANTNRAAAHAAGEWLLFVDHDDLLPPEAIWRIAESIAAHPREDVFYTDEDRVTQRGSIHTDAHRKPAFQPDTLRSNNYVCHLCAVRSRLFFTAGCMDSAYDGSQDHELMLRLSESGKYFVHVPHIGYHWRWVSTSYSKKRLADCQQAACRAIEAHTQRLGYPAKATVENEVIRLRYAVPDSLSVSVLLTCEKPDALTTAAAIAARLQQERPLVTVRQQVCPLNEVRRYLPHDGDILMHLRVSPGMTVSEGFLTELMMYAQREDVSLVCPVVLDRKGRILSAGYDAQSDGSLAPRSLGLRLSAGGFHRLAQMSVNVDAVSLDAFAIRAQQADLIHGWFSDRQIISADGWMVCTPHAQLRYTK